MIKDNMFCSKYVNVAANNIAADVQLAEGKFLVEEQTLNKAINYYYYYLLLFLLLSQGFFLVHLLNQW
jgi:hypothetical protein